MLTGVMIEPPRRGIDPVFPPVALSWQRIDAWLAEHAPGALSELRPPASKQSIKEAEERLGFQLPADLRESLLCHDGDTSLLGVLPCRRLYSVAEIIEIREMRMDIWEPDDPDQAETPWWGAQWVPFAGSDGDEQFIEAGPGPWHNHLGDAGHAEQAYFLGWPSLGSWLHETAESMAHHNNESWFGAVAPPKVDDKGRTDWWD
ncbi:SMI1/KNR4 family protein [Streptomyces avidinii]|uniref:SMI1/KNR4 family protein n=1 Tax=Streptomyces avidinii TaxID=1895 RepID=UPI00387094DB|nr:SMI1/KNR4 family protein [Streptomyces avidinii]